MTNRDFKTTDMKTFSQINIVTYQHSVSHIELMDKQLEFSCLAHKERLNKRVTRTTIW